MDAPPSHNKDKLEIGKIKQEFRRLVEKLAAPVGELNEIAYTRLIRTAEETHRISDEEGNFLSKEWRRILVRELMRLASSYGDSTYLEELQDVAGSFIDRARKEGEASIREQQRRLRSRPRKPKENPEGQ